MNKDKTFWACGRAMGGYPGSFPHGFLNRCDERFDIYDNKCLFPFGGAMPKDVSGGAEWTVNDINPEMGHTTHNATDMPESWSGAFDVVLCDPPYGEGWADELYDLDHPGYKSLWKEGGRCVKKGGYLLILDHLVYTNYSTKKGNSIKNSFEREHPIAITTGPNMRIRVLNIFKKVSCDVQNSQNS